MTARQILGEITQQCDAIHAYVRGAHAANPNDGGSLDEAAGETPDATTRELTLLCDQALQAYFWEETETLRQISLRVRELHARLTTELTKDGTLTV